MHIPRVGYGRTAAGSGCVQSDFCLHGSRRHLRENSIPTGSGVLRRSGGRPNDQALQGFLVMRIGLQTATPEGTGWKDESRAGPLGLCPCLVCVRFLASAARAHPHAVALFVGVTQMYRAAPNLSRAREGCRWSGYLIVTVAPSASSLVLMVSASWRLTFSFTGFGAPSTRSFASLRPRPVSSRTTLIT